MLFNKRSFRIILLILFFLAGQFIWHVLPVQAACVCNGAIKGKYSDLIAVPDGPPIKSQRQDTLKEIQDECVDDSSLNSADSCKTYLDDKAKDYSGITGENKYNSFFFDGSCQVQTCGAGNTAKFEITKPVLSILIPDLSFSDIATTTDENGNIQVPWIGEYIVAIYRLLVNVASILGVILIIREGIRVILSAGGDGKIEGYKNIGRIIIGLLLAWFSYVILYNLNSSLVSIRPLSIRAVVNNVDDQSSQEDDDSDDADVTAAINKSNQETSQVSSNLPQAAKCPWKRSDLTYAQCLEWQNSQSITFNGQKFTASNPCGAAPDDGRFAKFDSCLNPKTGQQEPILNASGQRKTVVVVRSMQAPLCRAIMIARSQDLDIRINSAYRDFPGQMKVFCDSFVRNKKAPSSGAIATPGNSNHGRGQAVDAFLFDKNGKALTLKGADTSSQCKSDPKYVAQIADIFYNADKANFKRLETEIWHFEYGVDNKDAAHDQFTTLPKSCK